MFGVCAVDTSLKVHGKTEIKHLEKNTNSKVEVCRVGVSSM